MPIKAASIIGIRWCVLYILALLHPMLVTTATDPADRKDVFGHYAMANQEQCHRLCWYRLNCTSYSYQDRSSPSRNGTPRNRNCVLHTDLGLTRPVTSSDGWENRPASSLRIHNGCATRPCTHREVCDPASSTSASYVCLSHPSQCVTPVVSHGNIITTGTSQDDVGTVTCDERYVASPRNVSVEIVCLVTSRWTKFAGECKQFEFAPDGVEKWTQWLPWIFQENSEVCFKGVFLDIAIARIRIFLTSATKFNVTHLKVVFQNGYNPPEFQNKVFAVVWEEGSQVSSFSIGDRKLARGDSFNITIRVLSDKMEFVLNKAHHYFVQWNDVRYRNGSTIDIIRSRRIHIKGDVQINYVNLLKGC